MEIDPWGKRHNPFNQFPLDIQSWNRFAYVLNNPLCYIDPSGYFSFRSFLKKWVLPALAIAAAWYIPGLPYFAGHIVAGSAGALVVAGHPILGAIVAGFVSGSIASGSLSGGIRSGVIAFATAGISNLFGAGTSKFPFGGASSGCTWGTWGTCAPTVGSGSVLSFEGEDLGGALDEVVVQANRLTPSWLTAAWSRASNWLSRTMGTVPWTTCTSLVCFDNQRRDLDVTRGDAISVLAGGLPYVERAGLVRVGRWMGDSEYTAMRPRRLLQQRV